MRPRVKAFAALAAFALLAPGALLLTRAAADPAQTRIAFQIATGASGGTYFPVGQAIAGLISHPPGVDRCEVADVCGPSGLILSARTSSHHNDNLSGVEQGSINSALVQGDVVADAVAGKDAFPSPQKHIRVIAALFSEPVYLVAAKNAYIAKISDLRSKRVSLSADTLATADRIFAAYGLSTRAMKMSFKSAPLDAALMQKDQIDAYFLMGDTPSSVVGDLLASGQVRLVPISGPGRNRLVKANSEFRPAVIPAGTYANTGALQTVATRAIWIVRDTASEALVYGITRALFQSDNQAALAASYPSAREVSLATAALDPPAPLHPGAARYYREMGKLPKTN